MIFVPTKREAHEMHILLGLLGIKVRTKIMNKINILFTSDWKVVGDSVLNYLFNFLFTSDWRVVADEQC